MNLEIFDVNLSDEQTLNLIRAFSGFNLLEDLIGHLKKVG